MHLHYKQGLLIPERQVTDTNPLFDLATIPRDLQPLPLTVVASPSYRTHTPHGKSRSISALVNLLSI